MDWEQSRVAYYFDLYLSPTLGLLASAFALSDPNLQTSFIPAIVLGFIAWTFIEYWTHRLLFHRFMRAAHDLHHERPGGYDAAPPWITTLIHMVLLSALVWSFDNSVALGAFIGMELGYLLYIWTHDKIHHGRVKSAGWLRRRYDHHLLHHRGFEKNFGVALFWWDRVFGTYEPPRADPRKGT